MRRDVLTLVHGQHFAVFLLILQLSRLIRIHLRLITKRNLRGGVFVVLGAWCLVIVFGIIYSRTLYHCHRWLLRIIHRRSRLIWLFVRIWLLFWRLFALIHLLFVFLIVLFGLQSLNSKIAFWWVAADRTYSHGLKRFMPRRLLFIFPLKLLRKRWLVVLFDQRRKNTPRRMIVVSESFHLSSRIVNHLFCLVLPIPRYTLLCGCHLYMFASLRPLSSVHIIFNHIDNYN